MTKKYPRHIKFENILNFRDIGGYRARNGKTVAWRRVFRSGDPRKMTANDARKIRDELGITTVLDLRSPSEFEQSWETGLLKEIGAKYFNVPYRTGGAFDFQKEKELYSTCSNMGEVYLFRARDKAFGKRVVESLEIIADLDNHPLLFHCGAGKDRSGILTAFLLSALGVADSDIVKDYTLTNPFMKEIKYRVNNDPEAPEEIKNLPDFTWKAVPEAMSFFLSSFKKEHGSVRSYLAANGDATSLLERLKTALLI